MTPWTIAYQALLSMEFSRQEYWNGEPFPSPGDLPDLATKPRSPVLTGRFFSPHKTGQDKEGKGKRGGELAQLNLGPLHWKHGVLATGPPGKCLDSL